MDFSQERLIKFDDLFKDIASEFSVQPNRNLVKLEIDKLLRRFNSELGLWKTIIRVDVGDFSDNWEDWEDYDWESQTTYNWIELGRWSYGWDYDTDEYKLTLSEDVLEVLRVYIDDVEWENKPFEYVKDSNNSSEYVYHQIGKELYFPIDLDSGSQELRLKVKRKFNQSDIEDGIDLPDDFRPLIVAGVVMSLARGAKHKDEDTFVANSEIYKYEFYQNRFFINFILIIKN